MFVGFYEMKSRASKDLDSLIDEQIQDPSYASLKRSSKDDQNAFPGIGTFLQ